jgi:pimeloyl-ACP methyl ester carboxylesterase
MEEKPVKIKNLILVVSVLVLASLSCRLFIPGTPTPEAPATLPPITQKPATPDTGAMDMESKLEELGGVRCAENPDFTCITIQVPLDHFDPANPETLDVAFAVAPAAGERYGMYVQAFPGGPGGEGISTGGLFWFPESILEHYDIVYFDQRGVGLSEPIACPAAYAKDFLGFLTETDQAGLEGYDTPEEQQAAVADARAFVEECVAEIGPDVEKLAFFGTDQVAEDLEVFRQVIGDEKFMLYGVSYGTAVAQTYAAAHPDRLMGLVLDGTTDLTLTGEAGALSQEAAFNEVLVATLAACDADEFCAADMGGDALAVYDELAARVSEDPIQYEFPLPSRETVSRTFTFNQLEFTTAYQMYSLGGRMLFLRALSAAKDGDVVPMARLLYQQAVLDPETFEYVGDPTFSDTMFYSVHCTDNSYFSGTEEERIAQTIEAGQASNGTVPRLDGSVYTGLTCTYWPSSPEGPLEVEPLVAEGVPTFVLNATLDPATPFHEGKAVFENLADGYHLYVEGGRHSIFGWGYNCPDTYIADFMLDGALPAQREIVCEEWGEAVISAYQPRTAPNARDYPDPLELFWATDLEIQLQPEYYYGSFEEMESVACPFGGSFSFGPGEAGEAYSFENCAYINGFILNGSGLYDYGSSLFTIDARVSGDKTGMLTYTRDDKTGSLSVAGEYGGEMIDLED